MPTRSDLTRRLSPFLGGSFTAVMLAGSLLPAVAAPTPWPPSPYTRRLVEEVLPDVSGDFDGKAFGRRGSRGATYLAAGLLWRDAPRDRTAAADILRGVLSLQYDDGPESKRHGVWRTRENETKLDANWREFVGCGLILVLERFPDRLPDDLVRDIRAALLRAAQGAARRDVGAGYTNIALMSAFLLDWVGTHGKRDDLQAAGRKKAEAIHALFARHKTFDEYNSPTYYGPDLMALALWREHACWDRMRALGHEMEADLWRDIGAFYHAGMKNLCGPFVRAYGMDMTTYCALAGLWIAMAVDDPALAPWPGKRARKSGEAAYAPVYALLRPEVPRDVMPHLKAFPGGRRELARPFGRSRATLLVDRGLMMGAARLARRWDQHHPATIYWTAAPGKPVGWILLTGLNEHVDPVVEGGALRIRRVQPSGEPIRFLVSAPGLDEKGFADDRWTLPGLVVTIERGEGVALDGVTSVKHPWYGPCCEVHYRTPGKTPEGAQVLILRPKKQ
jgi:hypothetical protein